MKVVKGLGFSGIGRQDSEKREVSTTSQSADSLTSTNVHHPDEDSFGAERKNGPHGIDSVKPNEGAPAERGTSPAASELLRQIQYSRSTSEHRALISARYDFDEVMGDDSRDMVSRKVAILDQIALDGRKGRLSEEVFYAALQWVSECMEGEFASFEHELAQAMAVLVTSATLEQDITAIAELGAKLDLNFYGEDLARAIFEHPNVDALHVAAEFPRYVMAMLNENARGASFELESRWFENGEASVVPFGGSRQPDSSAALIMACVRQVQTQGPATERYIEIVSGLLKSLTPSERSAFFRRFGSGEVIERLRHRWTYQEGAERLNPWPLVSLERMKGEVPNMVALISELLGKNIMLMEKMLSLPDNRTFLEREFPREMLRYRSVKKELYAMRITNFDLMPFSHAPERVIEMWDDESARVDERPIAVVVQSPVDANLAMDAKGDFEQLYNNYRVLFTQARNEEELEDAMRHFDAVVCDTKIQLMVIAGHGSVESIALGADDPRYDDNANESELLDLSDSEMFKEMFRHRLAPGADIVLKACSTGAENQEGNLAQRIAEAVPQGRVHAFPDDNNSTLLLDPEGTFESLKLRDSDEGQEVIVFEPTE